MKAEKPGWILAENTFGARRWASTILCAACACGPSGRDSAPQGL